MFRAISNGSYMDVEYPSFNRKVIRAYVSPQATEKQNARLARRLKFIYRLYYWRVAADNCLDFWGKAKGGNGNG